MKRICLWLMAVVLATSVLDNAKAQQLVERQGFEKKLVRMEFTEKTHEFGQVKEEDGPIRHAFEFMNTGEVPVKILSVQASCGCTTPDWTKEEIAPGEKVRKKLGYA